MTDLARWVGSDLHYGMAGTICRAGSALSRCGMAGLAWPGASGEPTVMGLAILLCRESPMPWDGRFEIMDREMSA